jgi:hypothetical protein
MSIYRDKILKEADKYYKELGDDFSHDFNHFLRVERLAKKFKMPDFGLYEVTEYEWLAGGKLSGKRFQDVESELKKRGYSPISL